MPAKKPAVEPEPCHALHYLGDESGTPHLGGIPSRDLTADDVRRLSHDLGLSVSDFTALALGGPFTEAAPANPAANSSADDSEKGDN